MVELSIGKGNTWVKRHPGYEMPGHPDGDARELGQRIGRVFLGRLAFEPSPFRALRLGQLARGLGP